MARQSKVERAQREAILAQRRAVVDEYGRLLAKLAPFKPDTARLADLAKSIRSWTADRLPSDNAVFSGSEFVAILGPCGMESRIPDMEAVYNALGHKAFLEFCSITLKALEVAGADIAALTVKEQTGSRSITVTPIPGSE